LQASGAGRTDTAFRDPELIGDVAVRRRIRTIEEQRQQGATPVIQLFQRPTNSMLTFDALQQFIRQQGGIGNLHRLRLLIILIE
jgi:hypothetical protein